MNKETEYTTPTPIEPESVTNGPILILLVVLLLSVLGGMYYWFTVVRTNTPVTIPTSLRPSAAQNNEPESTNAEAQAEAMGVVSTSDEIPAIEADVESTNLDSLDSELNAIEAEIDAALVEDPAAQ
jgi:flagellar basal body-associated protein FliL